MRHRRSTGGLAHTENRQVRSRHSAPRRPGHQIEHNTAGTTVSVKQADSLKVRVIAASAVRRAGLAEMVSKIENAKVTRASSISSSEAFDADVLLVDIATRMDLSAVARAAEAFSSSTGIVLLGDALD